MPKTRPCGPHSPAKCLLAPGPGAPAALKGPQPPSRRTSGTAWRKVSRRALPTRGQRWGRGPGRTGASPLPCPQSRLRLLAAAPTATGSRRGRQRSRTSRDPRPLRAQPRCQLRGAFGGQGAPPPPLVLRPALPQAAASGPEETAAKAKQSRSEKKARKVGRACSRGRGWSDNPPQTWGPPPPPTLGRVNPMGWALGTPS